MKHQKRKIILSLAVGALVSSLSFFFASAPLALTRAEASTKKLVIDENTNCPSSSAIYVAKTIDTGSFVGDSGIEVSFTAVIGTPMYHHEEAINSYTYVPYAIAAEKEADNSYRASFMIILCANNITSFGFQYDYDNYSPNYTEEGGVWSTFKEASADRNQLDSMTKLESGKTYMNSVGKASTTVSGARTIALSSTLNNTSSFFDIYFDHFYICWSC